MSFTSLKINDEGVLLFALHEQRFRNAGEEAVSAYHQFAAIAEPGTYALKWDNNTMIVAPRGESLLFDGMPVRYRVSPLVDIKNRISKTAQPNIYTNLREPGITTLLTSADGTEIYESCMASVIAWNGKQIVMVPADRPGVRSTMEELLKQMPGVVEEPILVASDYPIALVNAVKCTCTLYIEGREPFPVEQLEKIREFYLATARRA